MIKQFVCQLFSGECHLTSLRLDISNEFRWGPIHQCLSSKLDDCRNFLTHSCNTTLQRLHIRLNHSCFLESLIEYVPNLEQLSVTVYGSLTFKNLWEPNIETLSQSTKSWFNKVPKLQCFSLEYLINRERELIYLKWLLNNLNYVKKLQVNIQIGILIDSKSQNIWKCLVDANFVRQYCLPDIIPNLTDFNFYICSQCQLSDTDTWKIINSFNIHSFFIERQWTNVKCLFDSLQSYQHLFFPSSNMFQSSDKEIDRLYISKQLHLYDTSFYSYSSLHLFLEKLSQLSRHISDINVYKVHENDMDKFDLMMSLELLSKMRQNMKLNNPFRNVTKIQFGMYFDCKNSASVERTDGNEVRGKVLAHLISMTIQLKYLLVERFEWLLHVIQHAPNELRTNALITVQYAEFCLPSCHNGHETIHIGKSLVPFLSTYMPHLQALRLWRPDDFVWTTTRPDYVKYGDVFLMVKWLKSLQTCESIAQHVLVFEQDLCQLMDKLKDLTFLDIYGEIHNKKVEPYRLMAQTCFPRSRVYVEMSRFRIWF
ncbi:unnamed protein product [Adineta steineri]|uniref:Uncharacterized protein n=1 Tax=Adineta steineri TaxID=433720 RepID=A0A818SK88_9BILA|nr:unnamed protein product [Adineta steineri]CAF1094188.1 unnamed protein product [Adineta steineri]CAF3670728.1 unnamed protein product [Adineta steineri]